MKKKLILNSDKSFKKILILITFLLVDFGFLYFWLKFANILNLYWQSFFLLINQNYLDNYQLLFISITEFTFFTRFYCIIICWTLKIHYIDTLKIFLINFKILKLVVINIFWRYNIRIVQKSQREIQILA